MATGHINDLANPHALNIGLLDLASWDTKQLATRIEVLELTARDLYIDVSDPNIVLDAFKQHIAGYGMSIVNGELVTVLGTYWTMGDDGLRIFNMRTVDTLDESTVQYINFGGVV